MSILVSTLGSGKKTWGHVARLINEENWDDIYLITDEWGKEKFTPTKNVKWIIVNYNMGFDLLSDTIKKELPNDKKYTINFISGNSKEHMALVNVIRKKDKNFKLTILTKNGLSFY